MSEKETKLTTFVDANGESSLEPEKVDCCGCTDWASLSDLYRGLLATVANECIDTGRANASDCERAELFNLIGVIRDYREAYLARRIHLLEGALGLAPMLDIDQ